PPNPNGDAIMALDLTTGKKLWVYQATPNDSFMGGCIAQNKSLACPEKMGPDADIGNSPMLRSLPDGKRVLINGTKDGDVFALDPDNSGKLLWRVKANTGGGRGGIVWGGATDSQHAYYGFTAGGFAALKLATGERAWFNPITPPGGRGGNGAAATVIPGVVFASGNDGRLTAMSTVDGTTVWTFETARDFDTVNKVAGANGGTIGSAGPVIAGGMMFVGSGNGVGGGSDFGNVLLAFGVE
ncbi:MAG: PQQ-binding-like beta-propeller repeat protein, partial [Acidobacteriota bacterium]